jgi:hypothetical protein
MVTTVMNEWQQTQNKQTNKQTNRSVSSNSFQGTLPTEIGNLVNLENLYDTLLSFFLSFFLSSVLPVDLFLFFLLGYQTITIFQAPFQQSLASLLLFRDYIWGSILSLAHFPLKLEIYLS